MIKVKVLKKGALMDAQIEMSNLKTSCYTKLRKFSVAKLIEHGIIAKLRTSEEEAVNAFQIDSNSRSRERIITKILTSVYNNILKRIPFLIKYPIFKSFSVDTNGEIGVDLQHTGSLHSAEAFRSYVREHTGSSRIRAETPLDEVIKMFTSNITGELFVSEHIHDVKVMTRYVRYINKVSKSHNFPMLLKLQIHSVVPGISKSCSPGKEITINYHIVLRVLHGFWDPNATSVNTGFRTVSNSLSNSGILHGYVNIHRSFMFIPQITQVIRTLHRKGSFNGSAYIT